MKFEKLKNFVRIYDLKTKAFKVTNISQKQIYIIVDSSGKPKIARGSQKTHAFFLSPSESLINNGLPGEKIA